MTKDPSTRSRYNRLYDRKPTILLALVLVMVAAVGCINDLTPAGGWSQPVVEGDQFFVGNKDGNLVRFNPETGNVDLTWRYPLQDGLGAIYSSPVVIGDYIYGTGYTCSGDSCEGEIFGLNLADGTSVWGLRGLELQTKLVGQIGVVGTTLLVGTGTLGEESDGADGYIYAVESTPGAGSLVKWRIPLDGNAWTGVAVDGTTAYIGTMSGTLYAIDASDSESFAGDPTSRILWTFDAEGAIAGSIHADDGAVYFGDLSNHAYRLSASARSASSADSTLNTGSGEWKFDAGAWVWAEPVIEDGIVFVTGLDGSVHAVNDSDGSEKWSASVDGQIVAAPSLFDRKRGDTRERALAVPSGNKNVHVVSVIDGRELGVFVTDEPVKATPLVYENQLYVHAMNGDLKWYSVDDTTLRGCVDLKGGGRCD